MVKKSRKNKEKIVGIHFCFLLYLFLVDSKSPEASSQNHIKKPLSCEALSVFDGITVKVQYIGDEGETTTAATSTNVIQGMKFQGQTSTRLNTYSVPRCHQTLFQKTLNNP